MKKVWIIFMTMISVCLSACGTKKTNDDVLPMTDDNAQSIISDQGASDEESVAGVSASAEEIIALSNKKIEVAYKGDLYICYMVGAGDNLFLAGIEPDSQRYVIHKMKIEDETSKKLPIDIPEDMMIQGINFDREGNLHIFITDADRSVQKCEMWVTDQAGNTLRKVDMEKAFSESGPSLKVINEFVIDDEGRYYISKNKCDADKRGMIIFDEDGNSLGMVDSPNCKLWGTDSITRGREGKIYVANSLKDDDRIAVMSIDPEGLCIKDCYEGVLPAGLGRCTRLHAGIDADLYLYGADGIYSYNLGEESGKKIVNETEFPFSVEGGMCNDFLADGRFLFVDGESLMETVYLDGQEYPVNAGIAHNIVFYYIPVASGVEDGE